MAEAVYTHPAQARRLFSHYASGDVGFDNLAEGALLIALEEYPQISPSIYLRRLDDIAERIRKRLTSGEPPIFQLGHLLTELFEREGYSGNVTNYYDPRNSFLNEVIDTKQGIPITLSVLFIHLARKLGLDAVGVGLPGHYIVKARFDMSEVYVDPFHGGTTMSIQEIDEFLAQRSGGQLRLRSEYLRAWNARETLVRILTNLQSAWARQGDTRRALSARERIEILVGASA